MRIIRALGIDVLGLHVCPWRRPGNDGVFRQNRQRVPGGVRMIEV
jgi:hypothetical protein